MLMQRNEELLNRMEEVKREMNEQKEFYENALEERFNQMEAFESECFELRTQLQSAQ
jgi:chaperonin cofactor prefoldin